MLDRNLMELAHRGFSFGGDAVYGHRTHWQNWGGVVFDAPDFRSEKNYFAASAYAVVAGRAPFVESERHRLIWSAYGGIGKDLDRFSAFRLPGRPIGYEWEALSLPMMPGVAFTELFPRRYVMTDLTIGMKPCFFCIRISGGPLDWSSDPALRIPALSKCRRIRFRHWEAGLSAECRGIRKLNSTIATTSESSGVRTADRNKEGTECL